MFVEERFRGRDIAATLVTELVREAGARTTWCIPFEHLVGFYKRFAFTDHPSCAADVPDDIKAKLGFCGQTYSSGTVLLVRRAPG
jgi:GNAT superfamily N-acetyltransferase